jgi:hypothetical protein
MSSIVRLFEAGATVVTNSGELDKMRKTFRTLDSHRSTRTAAAFTSVLPSVSRVLLRGFLRVLLNGLLTVVLWGNIVPRLTLLLLALVLPLFWHLKSSLSVLYVIAVGGIGRGGRKLCA